MCSKRKILAQVGKIEELDRSFDITFWQEQGPNAIFAAAWELVKEYASARGIDESELRLQRTIGRISDKPD